MKPTLNKNGVRNGGRRNIFQTFQGRHRCIALIKITTTKREAGEQCQKLSVSGDDKCWYHGGVKKAKITVHHQGQKCTRTKLSTGEPCGSWAIQGGTLCHHHGGAQKKMRAAAERNVNQTRARQAMIIMGKPVVGLDPFDALMEEIARTAGHVRWLEAQVRGISVRDLIWGVTSVEKSDGDDPKGNYQIIKEEAVPHVWLGLYRKEREHLVYVCKTAIQCGIAERTVNLMEQQGMIIARVLEAALNDVELALNAAQHEAAKHIIGRHLRLVAGPDPNPDSETVAS